MSLYLSNRQDTPAEIHWYEANGIGKKEFKIKYYVEPVMKTEQHFVLCISNEGYAASIEPRKLYEHIRDEVAEKYKQIRVIDESGEDYLYPENFFIALELPTQIEKALRVAA